MRKFFFIAIGLFVIMLSACRSHRQASTSSASESTTVTFREVEKVVHIPGDSVKVTMQAASTSSANGAPKFIPQVQTIDTKRTKVTIELTKTGEIKATAVSKELEEKVTVLEKTVRTSTSSVTVFEQKDGWLKRTFKSISKTFKTVLITIAILSGLFAWFRFSGIIKSFANKIINKKS